MKVLLKWMMEHDLNSKQVARLLGFSESYLSMLFKGKRQVSIKVARAISDLTGETLDRILRAA